MSNRVACSRCGHPQAVHTGVVYGARAVPGNPCTWLPCDCTEFHHAVVVRRTDNHHGYPFRAECACGFRSQSYAAAHAAQPFADNHNRGE